MNSIDQRSDCTKGNIIIICSAVQTSDCTTENEMTDSADQRSDNIRLHKQ